MSPAIEIIRIQPNGRRVLIDVRKASTLNAVANWAGGRIGNLNHPYIYEATRHLDEGESVKVSHPRNGCEYEFRRLEPGDASTLMNRLAQLNGIAA